MFRVDKATYELHDRVPTYFIFRNRSSEIVVNVYCMVGEPSDCEFRFNVRTPSGKPAPPAAIRDPTFPGLFAGRFLRIPPGKTGGQEVDLSLYVKLEEEGVYTVAAAYTNRLSGRTSAGTVWVGTLQAPARTFRMVKEPSSLARSSVPALRHQPFSMVFPCNAFIVIPTPTAAGPFRDGPGLPPPLGFSALKLPNIPGIDQGGGAC